jgi:hypothetical protein
MVVATCARAQDWTQNLSETNWTDVPTATAVNVTNLHQELIVGPSSEIRFFRLKH